jgi:c-di-AMP phosphodiesterase-like protein
LYTKIASPIFASLSLAVGVVIFIINSKRTRAKNTLYFWEKINQDLKIEKSELEKDYGPLISNEMALLILDDKNEAKWVNRVINVYERLGAGVNIGAYDVGVINRLVGQNIIDNYERFSAYIEARRVALNRPFAWVEFQKLVGELRRIRE